MSCPGRYSNAWESWSRGSPSSIGGSNCMGMTSSFGAWPRRQPPILETGLDQITGGRRAFLPVDRDMLVGGRGAPFPNGSCGPPGRRKPSAGQRPSRGVQPTRLERLPLLDLEPKPGRLAGRVPAAGGDRQGRHRGHRHRGPSRRRRLAADLQCLPPRGGRSASSGARRLCQARIRSCSRDIGSRPPHHCRGATGRSSR